MDRSTRFSYLLSMIWSNQEVTAPDCYFKCYVLGPTPTSSDILIPCPSLSPYPSPYPSLLPSPIQSLLPLRLSSRESVRYRIQVHWIWIRIYSFRWIRVRAFLKLDPIRIAYGFYFYFWHKNSKTLELKQSNEYSSWSLKKVVPFRE